MIKNCNFNNHKHNHEKLDILKKYAPKVLIIHKLTTHKLFDAKLKNYETF